MEYTARQKNPAKLFSCCYVGGKRVGILILKLLIMK